MRPILLVLLTLLLLIQYPLWLGNGSWTRVWVLREDLAALQQVNEGLRQRNAALTAEVSDLQDGTEAAEEHARIDLGMQNKNEIFVQILPDAASSAP
ncbi:cell division protein FtsB [Alcaligenaceae bacterium SJ-26]|nr:cell division protein FtsB [Alcaligenaceae bacterium SJ-26]